MSTSSPHQDTQHNLQQHIGQSLGVIKDFTATEEIHSRVNFLKEYLVTTGAQGFVLGISGGQDSTLAGALCQMAVSEIRKDTPHSTVSFTAMRLPYGAQYDEEDAQIALDFIQPDQSIVVNIAEPTDTMASQVETAIGVPVTDFNKGNIKARQRMIAQYAVAGEQGKLVVGTDHAAEAITGFYTKFGDGAADLMPLAGLTKNQGAKMLQVLGAPESTWTKVPTADLEGEKPGLPDEQALGVSYSDIDSYLLGNPITPEAQHTIESRWTGSEHKRHLPATPQDSWWKKSES